MFLDNLGQQYKVKDANIYEDDLWSGILVDAEFIKNFYVK